MKDLFREIKEFRSPIEFSNHINMLDQALKIGDLNEVPVLNYYAGPNFKERWFELTSSNQIWRLIYPDGPFHGFWGRVNNLGT